MFRRLLFLAVATCAFASSSCGNSSGLYPVNGKVLFEGEPAVGATVTFLRKDAIGSMEQNPQGGVVEEDGTFTLAGPKGAGAKPGEYIVLVEWKEGAGKLIGRGPALNAPDRLKKRYLDQTNPLLTATVEAKTNNLPPFELTSK
jgi:hypothetical protein